MHILTKKKVYFIFGILVMLCICFFSTLTDMSDNNYMIWEAIGKLSKQERIHYSIWDAFSTGAVSMWMYILFPIVASIPSASAIADEIQSKYYLYIEERKGKKKYLYAKYFQNFASAGIIVFAAMAVFILILCIFFPLNHVYSGITIIGEENYTVWGLGKDLFLQVLYMTVYGIAVSIFVSLITLLYQNLYFVLSVAFILNYILRDLFMKNQIIYPCAMIVILFLLYRVVWKVRGEKL